MNKISNEHTTVPHKKKENIGWLIWLIVSIAFCFFLTPLGVISFLVWLIAFGYHKNKEHAAERNARNTAFKEHWHIPEGTPQAMYHDGAENKFFYINYDSTNCVLNLWENSALDNSVTPYHKSIKKDDIVAFTQLGDITNIQNVQTKGGGPSIGGAIIGNAIAGPVGAVIGGHKKVRTKTINTTTDTRQVVLKFKDNGVEKSIVLSFSPTYSLLCRWIPEKKI